MSIPLDDQMEIIISSMRTTGYGEVMRDYIKNGVSVLLEYLQNNLSNTLNLTNSNKWMPYRNNIRIQRDVCGLRYNAILQYKDEVYDIYEDLKNGPLGPYFPTVLNYSEEKPSSISSNDLSETLSEDSTPETEEELKKAIQLEVNLFMSTPFGKAMKQAFYSFVNYLVKLNHIMYQQEETSFHTMEESLNAALDIMKAINDMVSIGSQNLQTIQNIKNEIETVYDDLNYSTITDIDTGITYNYIFVS